MATAYKPRTSEPISDRDDGMNDFIEKLHNTIQDARSKLSDDEVEKADQEAKEILDRASAIAKSSRHSA